MLFRVAIFATCAVLGTVGVSATETGNAALLPETPLLDAVQREIAAYKGRTADGVAGERLRFRQLASDYLLNLGYYVEKDRPFDITYDPPAMWHEFEPRVEAFGRLVRAHMAEWHPLFALTFVELVVEADRRKLYALMMHLEGQHFRDAIRQRTRELASGLPPAEEDPTSRARQVIDHEVFHLYRLIEPVLRERVVPVLCEALRTYSLPPRADVVGRVAWRVDRLLGEPDQLWLGRTLRKDPALVETIHGLAVRIVVDPQLDLQVRTEKLEQLLGMLARLQTPTAMDHLLLVFDEFDEHAEILGDQAEEAERSLVKGLAAFVDASRTTDPDAVLGLEVTDQLTRWILNRLELEYPDLRHGRVIDALYLLREQRPGLLLRYVERFHRDFHALDPAGYESVVLRLLDLVVDYADHGAFRIPREERAEPEADTEVPMQLRLLEVLGWYDTALAEAADTLPRIDSDLVRRRQREIMRQILVVIERFIETERRSHEFQEDPRLVERMRPVLERTVSDAPDEETLESLRRFLDRSGG